MPDDFLLFFQRVKWDDKLASSGRTIWNELVHRYSLGVDAVQTMRDQWATVQGRIDTKRFNDVTGFLQTQHYEARWWRDACLTYFASLNKPRDPAPATRRRSRASRTTRASRPPARRDADEAALPGRLHRQPARPHHEVMKQLTN